VSGALGGGKDSSAKRARGKISQRAASGDLGLSWPGACANTWFGGGEAGADTMTSERNAPKLKFGTLGETRGVAAFAI
jgi:hypothetical protein